jgi:O-antigen ligase
MIHLRYRSDALFSVIFFGSLFIPLTFFNYMTEGFETPKLFLWLICFAVATIIWVRRPVLVWRWHKWWGLSCLLFLLTVVLSAIFSLDWLNSVVGLYGRYTSSIVFFVLWLGWMFLLLAALNSRDKLLYLYRTLVVAGLLVAILGILQYFGIAFYPGINGPVRVLAPSFLGNPNFSSMFIVGVLPLAWYFFVSGSAKYTKLYYGSAALLLLIAVIIFSSRGSIAGMFASLVIMLGLVAWFRLWRTAAITAILLALSLTIFIPFLNASRPEALTRTIALSETTVNTRFLAWNNSIEMISRNPWLGTGPGNFFLLFKMTDAFDNGERFDDAHNLFLHVGASLGLPALVLFLLIIFIPVHQTIHTITRSRDLLAAVELSALAALLVSFSFNPVTLACWLLLGTILAGIMSRQMRERVASTPPVLRWGGWLAAAVIIVAASGFIVSEYLSYSALSHYRNGEFSSALNKSRWAIRANPTNSNPRPTYIASRIKLNQDALETEKHIERFVMLHPKSSGLRQTAEVLYYMLYKQTNREEYRQKIYEAIAVGKQLEPNYSGLRGHIAYIHYKLGDKDLAMQEARYAVTMNSNQFFSWILVAKINLERGQKEPALYALEQAYKLRPDTLLLKMAMQQIQGSPQAEASMLPVFFPEPDI